MLHDVVNDVGAVAGANVVVALTLVTLFTVMIVMAMPRRRAAASTTGFRGATTALRLGRAGAGVTNTPLFVDRAVRRGAVRCRAVNSPSFWLIVLTTVGAAWPVAPTAPLAIAAERPSTHARHHPARSRRDAGASERTRPISCRPDRLAPLRQRAGRPGRSGYRMVDLSLGDWTGRLRGRTAFTRLSPWGASRRWVSPTSAKRSRRVSPDRRPAAGIGPMARPPPRHLGARPAGLGGPKRRTAAPANWSTRVQASQPDALIWAHRHVGQARASWWHDLRNRRRRVRCRGRDLHRQPDRHRGGRPRPLNVAASPPSARRSGTRARGRGTAGPRRMVSPAYWKLRRQVPRHS